MTTQVRRTRPSSKLSLKDRLSRLSYLEAVKLLGPEGKSLIQKGARDFEFDVDEHVYLAGDLFRLKFPAEQTGNGQPLTVSITLMAEARDRLHWHCNGCEGACVHAGAAFSLILEEKLALKLAAPPKERIALAGLPEEALTAQALAERAERARSEKMTVQSADASIPWTDYTVTNRASGKSYRVALRGAQPGDSYCSCPDFRTNTLGTCKHVLHVLRKIGRQFTPRQMKQPPRRTRIAVHLR